MKTNLLNQFSEFIEKQDILIKLTESEKLHSYRYSEIGVIIAIGTLKSPNVTEIARKQKMTKGAVSKITKRLAAKGDIEIYSLPDNNQKVFFKLTEKGRVLFEEHEKRHTMWLQRDLQFLDQFSDSDLEKISCFMDCYNEYLGEKIQEINKES